MAGRNIKTWNGFNSPPTGWTVTILVDVSEIIESWFTAENNETYNNLYWRLRERFGYQPVSLKPKTRRLLRPLNNLVAEVFYNVLGKGDSFMLYSNTVSANDIHYDKNTPLRAVITLPHPNRTNMVPTTVFYPAHKGAIQRLKPSPNQDLELTYADHSPGVESTTALLEARPISVVPNSLAIWTSDTPHSSPWMTRFTRPCLVYSTVGTSSADLSSIEPGKETKALPLVEPRLNRYPRQAIRAL